MFLQKLFLCIFIFTAFSYSQNKSILLRFLKIDPKPCEDCAVFIDSVCIGNTDLFGKIEYYYDSTKRHTYHIEVIDTLEKISKSVDLTLGKNQNDPQSQLIFLNHVGAYVSIDENRKNITEKLISLKNNGVTDIFAPAFTDGKALYPSKVDGVKSLEEDKFGFVITECKRLNLRVFAIINTLNWGSVNSASISMKDLLMVNKKGEYQKGVEGDALFVSPSNPEVIRILTEITNEISVNYKDLSGISFNYLRFKKGNFENLDSEDFGFDKYTIDLFRSTNKIDPFLLKFEINENSDWMKWISFKENLITNLLVKMISKIYENNSDLKTVLTLDPHYLTERGKNLSCANAYEIEQFARPDFYLLDISEKDMKKDLRVLDQYIDTDNPFEDPDVRKRRASAFIPLINFKEQKPVESVKKAIDYLCSKGKCGRLVLGNLDILEESDIKMMLQQLSTK